MTEPGFEPRYFRCPSKYCNHSATEADDDFALVKGSRFKTIGIWCGIVEFNVPLDMVYFGDGE